MSKKHVLAVSGGVDSVVLLHQYWQEQGSDGLVVAHFDHGIRTDSSADARFVEALAASYGIKFESRREELGSSASEAWARERRYHFLREVADSHQAVLVTAHHGDDLIETIAINLSRGTGWRGLAVFGNANIQRPLLGYRKRELYDYAIKHRLEWVEDETNLTGAYLRNQMRRYLAALPSDSRVELAELYRSQSNLRQAIDQACSELLLSVEPASRHLYIMLPVEVADELLRRHLIDSASTPLTRPQRQQVLLAIKTMPSGRVFEAGEGVKLRFDIKRFTVEKSTPVLS